MALSWQSVNKQRCSRTFKLSPLDVVCVGTAVGAECACRQNAWARCGDACRAETASWTTRDDQVTAAGRQTVQSAQGNCCQETSARQVARAAKVRGHLGATAWHRGCERWGVNPRSVPCREALQSPAHKTRVRRTRMEPASPVASALPTVSVSQMLTSYLSPASVPFLRYGVKPPPQGTLPSSSSYGIRWYNVAQRLLGRRPSKALSRS